MIPARNVDGSFIPHLNSSVTLAILDGEAVLFDEQTGRLLTLNSVATIILSCFDGRSPLEEIVMDLAQSFTVDVSVVRADVFALALQLKLLGVVQGMSGTTGLTSAR